MGENRFSWSAANGWILCTAQDPTTAQCAALFGKLAFQKEEEFFGLIERSKIVLRVFEQRNKFEQWIFCSLLCKNILQIMTTKYQILDLAKNISNISKKIFEQRVKV